MAIKFNEYGLERPPETFPCLAKHKISGNVYFLTSSKTGVKVSGPIGVRKVGEVSTTLDDQDEWVVLPQGSTFTFTQE